MQVARQPRRRGLPAMPNAELHKLANSFGVAGMSHKNAAPCLPAGIRHGNAPAGKVV